MFSDAQDKAVAASRSWLAAAMQGSIEFNWNILARRDVAPGEEGDSVQTDVTAWIGNPNRKLWRETCLRAAESVRRLLSS